MKNTSWLMGTLVVLLISIITTCKNKEKPGDTSDQAKQPEELILNNDLKIGNYLKKAAEINLEDIELGLLAESKSKRTAVINLGKMMVNDHHKSMNDLMGLAMKKYIIIPVVLDGTSMENIKKLSLKSGSEFDKEFCDLMIKHHKEAVLACEKISENSEDEDIKTWAVSTLPTLRLNLDNSITCQYKCEKMK